MPSEKTLAELQSWVASDMNRWSQRNQRFQRDQELYQMMKPDDLRARVKSDIIVLNDPKVLVKKVSRLIARHPNVIEVPAAPDTDGSSAQKIENFLYLWDQAVNQRWMMGLNNPYRYDQAFHLILRGWSCERTMLRDDSDDEYDPAGLWDHQVFDPANVYPYAASGQIVRVVHAYSATWGDVRYDPFLGPRAKKIKSYVGMEDRETIQLKACYWRNPQDGGWYHAVLLAGGPSPGSAEGGEWLKEPTELGYNPWTIVLANGASYRQTPWDEIGYLEQVGTGILDESAENQKYLNRMVTKLNEMLSLESNPPVSIYSANGQVRKISFEPGARNFFSQRDKLEAHRIGPSLNDYQLLWDILQKRADRAGLPSAFFAEYGGESGFSAAVLMAAGKDILFPFVEAINQADALKYRKVLELYRDFGPSKPLRSKLPPDGMGRVLSTSITPQEIKTQGTFVEITREDMTPQELATRINLAMAMVREKLISLKTARKDWVKLKNPDGENLQVLSELVYMNEDVTKALAPIALAATGQEQLRKIWEMTQNPMPAQMPQQMPQQPQMPGMPPQTPGQPTGQPPGLPAQAMPPIAGGNMLTNLQASVGNPAAGALNPLLQLLTGGAVGGAGGGGLPPRPGTTSPVPLILPPNRLF